jgi:hypothetical protein
MARALVVLKRALLLALVAVGLLLVGCGSVVWRTMTANNRLVQEWVDALSRYPAPPESELLAWGKSEFGLLEGNGNHCDIRITLDVLTRLSASEVKQYYLDSGLAERLAPTRRGLIGVRVWVSGDPWTDGRSVIRVELLRHSGNMGDGCGFDPRCY